MLPDLSLPDAPSFSAPELARRFEMNRSHVQMLLKKHGLHSKDFRNHAASTAKEKDS